MMSFESFHHVEVKALSYTANFKLKVIEKANEMGNREAARFFNVDKLNIRLWRKNKTNFENCDRQFFTLLNAKGKKELIKWCMKEGLIASSYECPKCNDRHDITWSAIKRFLQNRTSHTILGT
ncbi:UNVERIFIED_CONTAM: hypothetical protein NCL1_32257 [Trichonephila clavipes]